MLPNYSAHCQQRLDRLRAIRSYQPLHLGNDLFLGSLGAEGIAGDPRMGVMENKV
jgi:hypothetical protein